MPKLIFFDIDGTLWDDHMQIPDSTVETIRLLRENGHKTFLCSGRARGNIRSERLLSLDLMELSPPAATMSKWMGTSYMKRSLRRN